MRRLVTVAVLIGAALTAGARSPNRPSTQVASTNAREGREAIQVAPGFEVELVAGPPLIRHPMLVGFDDRGRLFVSDNAGVNLDKAGLTSALPSAIRMLEDADGDGVFEKAGVFVDRLTFPQGALWHEGALFAASPPSMWRFDDTNGDGVADARKEIATGFDFTGNAADIHGPFLSPGGRLFWCHGRKGHEVYDGPRLVSKALGARIWTSRADGTDLQVFAGGGMDNPAEVTFSDEGDVFGTVNIFHSNPRTDAVVHWVYGGVYPRADQEQALGEFKRTGELLAPAVTLGHVAPAGIMRYRSRELGAAYHDNLFIAEFNTHRITRIILEPHESTFIGRTEVFASSTDPDLHFTDVLEDADGSLLVVDTGGWFSSGCPTSGVSKPDVTGAIYRIRRSGAHRVADPRGLSIAWATAPPEQLVAYLGDPRFAVRDRAIAALARAGDAAVPDLTRTLTRGDRQTRLAAVWGLTRIDTPGARTAVRAALNDTDAGVRRAGCHSAFTTRDAGAAPRLIELLADAAPAVRREAAAALGRLGTPRAVPPLLRALASPTNDQMLDHALTYALIEINDPASTAAGLADRSPRVRRAALIALDQMASSTLRPDQVFPLLDSDVASLRTAALRVIAGRRSWAGDVVAQLQRRLAAGRLTIEQSGIARELVVKFGRDAGVQELAGRALTRPDLSRSDRAMLLTALGDLPGVEVHPTWIAPLKAALMSGDAELISAAIDVIRAGRAAGFDDELRRIGADTRYEPLLRVAALQAVQGGGDAPAGRGRGGPPPLDASSFDLAVELLTSASVPTRVQAAQLLARSSLGSGQLLRLAGILERAGPMELQAMVPILAASRDPQIGSAFVLALAKSPALFALTEGDIRRSFRSYPPDVVASAADLARQLLLREQDKERHLTQLASVLNGGDVTRGRQLFESGKGSCIVCHRIGSTGGQVGPNLSGIGRVRTGHELLDAITYPSDSIARGFDAYNITMQDGRSYVGTVQRETTDTVYVTPFSGPQAALRRDEIKTLAPSPVSLMPPGLDALFSREELGDLVAYLLSLK